MLDMTMEIDKLRQDLRLQGHQEDAISFICQEAQKEIMRQVDQVIEQYMTDAQLVGLAKGIESFIEQLRVTRLGADYEITTDSGQTDFSSPPFPMLPKLLKNAKVAKDGSLYKVIPMKQKIKKKALTTVDIMRQINSNRSQTQVEADTKKDDAGSVDFRTASSKQDASSKWVHPGKDANITHQLRDINAKMGLDIDKVIQTTIEKYRGRQ